MNKLTLEDFSPHLGTRFLLRTESGQTVEVELIEAAALASSGPRPASLSSRMPFSLVFLAPKQSGLCQQIYRIEHEEMGEFDIFLVPIGMTDKGLQCEAIFN